jgi:hypothetical protein
MRTCTITTGCVSFAASVSAAQYFTRHPIFQSIFRFYQSRVTIWDCMDDGKEDRNSCRFCGRCAKSWNYQIMKCHSTVTRQALSTMTGACTPTKMFQLISRLPCNSWRMYPIQKIPTVQIVLIVFLNGATALIKTSNARFCNIKRTCLSLIRVVSITLCFVSNMTKESTNTSSALRNINIYLLNWTQQTHNIIV